MTENLRSEHAHAILDSDTIVEVEEVSIDRKLHNVSFKAHKGEVLGLVGVEGSGISEIGKVLMGIEQEYTGGYKLNGIKHRFASPKDAVKAGIGYVPKERKDAGIIPRMSVGDNIILSSLKNFSCFGLVKKKLAGKVVNEILEEVDLLPRNPQMMMEALSGGNQQKGVKKVFRRITVFWKQVRKCLRERCFYMKT